jgi:hypothetical protein
VPLIYSAILSIIDITLNQGVRNADNAKENHWLDTFAGQHRADIMAGAFFNLVHSKR